MDLQIAKDRLCAHLHPITGQFPTAETALSLKGMERGGEERARPRLSDERRVSASEDVSMPGSRFTPPSRGLRTTQSDSGLVRATSDIEVWSAADSADRGTDYPLRQPLLSGVDPIQVPVDPLSPSIPDHGPPSPERAALQRRVKFAIWLSLGLNVALLGAKLAIYVVTLSNSVMASLADSVVDILSQGVIAFAERQTRRADPRYPVGKTRLETIGVIVSAGIMSVCSIEVIQSSCERLWRGFADGEPERIHVDPASYAVLGLATLTKVALYLFCRSMRDKSPSALALSEDHLNDCLSNTMALAAAAVASEVEGWWWADSAGGASISIYVIARWIVVAKGEVDKLVGKGADDHFVQRVKEMADEHHKMLMPDEIRAYFFGQKYFGESAHRAARQPCGPTNAFLPPTQHETQWSSR